MDFSVEMLLILCPFVFLAGFVDSIAGGGGIIALPAYLFAGFPVHFAYGTNKFSSSIGTVFSTFRFVKNGQFELKSAAVSIVSALVGSFLGARLALLLDESFLRYFLLVMLPVTAAIVLFRKGFGEKDRSSSLSDGTILILSILSGLIIGAYDGFFGPGTGTFLILTYTGVLGFSLTRAAGNAKLVNLASNVAALVAFLADGKVLFLAGIPAALSGIAGHWIGSGLALKNGAKIIRPVISGVFFLLFLKLAYDLTGRG